MADESSRYEARSAAIANNVAVKDSGLFALPMRRYWFEGPNGRHLCLVFPVLGPHLSILSNGLDSRLQPAFVRRSLLQAAQGLRILHSQGLCHADLTASNISLHLTEEFQTHDEDDLLPLLGYPKTDFVRTYPDIASSPHIPEYVVAPLDFCFCSNFFFSDKICIAGIEQSFTIDKPPHRVGTPAKYLAPEVAIGVPSSPASDIWALGCAIFRTRTGEDLLNEYEVNCPADALQHSRTILGDFPDAWWQARFDDDGYFVNDEDGDIWMWKLPESQTLQERLSELWDEPAELFLDRTGAPVDTANADPDSSFHPDDRERKP
ncbi:hypothetical protein G7046_g3203 [Stylonectria norvegica]|nr:hypothetical protein G7046_g3203 [Stylonectria norvegica]